jgi:hypothetical protein
MNSCSFSEHKQKCTNRGKNKVITVHQGGFLYQLESFSMVYVLNEVWYMSSTSIYHSLAPTWHAPCKPTEITLRYQAPIFCKSLF